MSSAQIDPHNKMRARDLSRVARGEQAPKPAREFGTVSPSPPPSSTDNFVDSRNNSNNNYDKEVDDYLARHCYVRYVEYHKCLEEKGQRASECEKIAKYYRSFCPSELIDRWNEERERGTFPGPI